LLKRYLTSLLIMVAPEPGVPLLLYFADTSHAVSMVLIVERLEPQEHQVPKGSSICGFGPRIWSP
jgi:hypothetical protein